MGSLEPHLRTGQKPVNSRMGIRLLTEVNSEEDKCRRECRWASYGRKTQITRIITLRRKCLRGWGEGSAGKTWYCCRGTELGSESLY